MTTYELSEKNEETDLLLVQRLEKFGKREILLWKEMVLHDELLFAKVYKLIYSDNPRIAWHAAWIIDHVSEVEPDKLKPFIPELIDELYNLKSSSLKRHFTRMILRYEVPENRMGRLVDLLYNFLSTSEAIAVRANSLEILHKLAILEPNLRDELIRVTDAMLEDECTAGILSKGRKILRSLQSIDAKVYQTRVPK